MIVQPRPYATISHKVKFQELAIMSVIREQGE